MNLVPVGYFKKTYSYRGELEVVVTNPSALPTLKGWIFVLLNGNLIPFFIETYTEKSGRHIVSLKYITSDHKAKHFVGKEILVAPHQTSISTEPEFTIQQHKWEGFAVIDTQNHLIGHLSTVLEHSENPLLQVFDANHQEILIPYNSTFLKTIHEDKQQLIVELPDGFMDLYHS